MSKAAKVSSGDTGGPRDIALIGAWALTSFGLYKGAKFLGTLLGDGADALVTTAFLTRVLGFAALGAALALTFLLVFGRKVGANATVLEANEDPTQRYHEEEGVTKLMPTAGFATGKTGKAGGAGPKQFTLAEVGQHATKDNLWIVVDKKAYDVTEFVEAHPGGVGPMAALAGKDCTDVFANYHAIKVYKYMLPRYYVGEVTDVEDWEHVADFRAVRQELLRRGLFETDYRYYAMFACWYATLFLGSIWLSLGCLGDEAYWWGRLAGAVTMGIFWQQLAGLGHDLGHSGVTHNFHKDHQIGSALTALMGLSLCWWKSDHNTHHVVCNSVEHDPNIQHMPIIAIHENIFSKPFWDTYHKRIVAMDAVARFLVSWQHVFFYPLMFFGRVNLYVQGIIFLLSKPDTIHYRMSELSGLAVYGSWLVAVVSAQPTYADAGLWMLLSHGVAGLLHVQIVMSHWSMDVYNGRAYNNKDDEWYTMQLKTTMNVDTYEPLDWVHIGLQFQVEHHLFPRLPRHSLRAARELIIPVCEKHGLDYHEPGFFEGNLKMWGALRDAAMAARKTTKGDGGFYTSKIWEGLNLSG